MQKTSRAPTSRPLRRAAILASATASFAALLSTGGCDAGTVESVSNGIAVSGSGGLSGSSGAKSTGGSSVGTGGVSGSSGAKSTGGSSATGGTATISGGAGIGGALTISGGAAGGGGAPSAGGGAVGVTGGSGGASTSGGVSPGTGGKPPCMDVEPPPDPKWPGATCVEWAAETTECQADWFKAYCDVSCGRCVPEGGSAGGSGTAGAPGVDCSTQGLPNVSGGNGFATRYWDCCQPHCSQSNGHRCNQDGTSITGNTQSSCTGGGSFACYDEAPRAVNDCLSYGHFAKANPNCGACYRIQFTGEGEHNANDPGSRAIKGKQMVVKVTNTGGDVAGNQFDLMIPGGGVGQFNACSRQWGTNDLGAQYGGFLTECTGSHQAKKDCVRQECMKIPAGKARDGCIWFVDWFQVADNPKFTSQQTDCPF